MNRSTSAGSPAQLWSSPASSSLPAAEKHPRPSIAIRAKAALGMGLVCLALALLSWRLQGFAFGTDNNVFHIPIVLRWFDLPQFSGDPFVQSLRGYATPVYAFLGLFANEANIETVFFAAFLATRALTIYAMLLIMRACGLRGVWLAAAGAGLVLASAVYGETVIGRDELFVSIFTHTALAQAVALIGVASLMRGRLTGAAIAAGLAFDLNVMVGVWALVPVMLTALIRLIAQPRTRIRETLLAAAAFALISLPVAAWIVATQNFAPPDFDYRKFLIGYYPNHFFIGWARWPDRIMFALQLLSGMTAAALLPRNGGKAALVLAGFALVFVAGIAVGQLSHSRFLLNQHLLRVDGMATWLAVALVLAAAFAALSKARDITAFAGIAAVSGLIANDWRMVFAALLLLGAGRLAAWRAGRSLPQMPLGKAALNVVAAVAFAGTAFIWGAYSQAPVVPPGRDVPSDEQLLGARPAAPYWLEVTRWARSATQADAMFLVPPKLDFVAAAQRRSWVGWKEGAAVMWAPGFYPVWRTRSDGVAALHSVQATLRYACQHRIDYVVLDKRPGKSLSGATTAHAVFDNRWFAIVSPGCAKVPGA